MVVAGRFDQVRPPAASEQFSQTIPGARFELIEAVHMQASTMRRTVGNGAVSNLKRFAPTAWLAKQMSAMVIASPWQ